MLNQHRATLVSTGEHIGAIRRLGEPIRSPNTSPPSRLLVTLETGSATRPPSSVGRRSPRPLTAMRVIPFTPDDDRSATSRHSSPCLPAHHMTFESRPQTTDPPGSHA